MVSVEALKSVCAAEEEARQAISLARQNALEAVEAAQRAGTEAVASTVARAESEIAHLTRAMDHRATESAKELASKTANRQATLRARAGRRLDAAAGLIVERIVNV